MTNEQVERAIEFLLEHHSKVSADIERHSDQIAQLTRNVSAMQTQIDSIITEMHDGFNKLILANEVTRELAENIGRLAVATSQRVTDLESSQ